MAPVPHAPDQILVAVRDTTAFLRVRQRGSFKVSTPLKQFGQNAIEHGVHRFVFDMQDCIGMDSTFMGVLAGLAFRLQEVPDSGLWMIDLNSRTRGLLATLGLDRLVHAYIHGAMPPELQPLVEDLRVLEALPEDDSTRLDTAEMMLEAHRNLVELSPENLPRFKDVLTFLREDVEKASGPSATDDPEDSSA